VKISQLPVAGYPQTAIPHCTAFNRSLSVGTERWLIPFGLCRRS